MKKNVTLIVPVYGDWPSLKECIESLFDFVDTSSHKVMLVNDCGPEADTIEKDIKNMIGTKKGYEYFRNKKNLGFLKNCNNAVNNLDKTDNDILLLNSDAKVTEGFLEEMQGVLKGEDKIGAVSPRSNNATICTIPLSSAPQKGIDREESFLLFSKIYPKLPEFSITPTAHGFCMLIRREIINKYGLFDEIFGKGYGEEVDFCQRIRKKGYMCALANHAYVFHQEARSFSLDTKAKLLEINNKIIWERWPDYRQEVQEYMRDALIREDALSNKPTNTQKLKNKLKRTNIYKRLRRN